MEERRSKKRNSSQLLLKNVPVISRLTIASGWSVSLSGETFSFAFKATGANNLHFDPYLVRDKFLSIATPKDALAFLRTFGPLEVRTDLPGVDVPPGAAGTAPRLRFTDLLDAQSFYKEVLTEPRYWANRRNFVDRDSSGFSGLRAYFRLNLLRSPNLTISLDRSPFVLAESAYVSQAIYTTIYLDWLSGLKSVSCPVCHKIVRQRTQHFQRFCSTRCGNLSRKEKYLKTKERHDAKA